MLINSIEKKIAELRILVGFLGEKNFANWWNSAFFSHTATAFLTPIFNRSLFLAQYQGVTAAAAKIHDHAIGIGCIYHLFRLPIGLEQASSEILNTPEFSQRMYTILTNRELALAHLAELSDTVELISPGPILLGQMNEDLDVLLKHAGGLYYRAFISNVETFPYIREI